MKKILPITNHSEITLYTHYSLPFQIPFITEKTKPWFMSCFVNVFYRYEFPTFYDYTDYNIFYRDLMFRDSLTYNTALKLNTQSDFTAFLNDDKYIYAWVDQYYISATPYYQKYHDVHPILIYGYDDIENTYMCRCFTSVKSVYDAVVKCDEYHEALYNAGKDNACINDEDVFCLFKVKKDASADFILENFVRELYDYSCGRGSHKGFYFSQNEVLYDPKDYNKSVFGIQVTSAVLHFLKNNDGRYADHRLLHMICENKRLIADRLKYIINTQYIISDELVSFVKQYEELAVKYEQIRNLSMLLSFKENNNEARSFLPQNEANINRLYDKIKKLYEDECVLLNKIMPKLRDSCVYNRFPRMRIYEAEKSGVYDKIKIGESRFIDYLVVFNSYESWNSKILIDGKDIEEIIQTNDISLSGNTYKIIELKRKITTCELITRSCDPGDNIGFYALNEKLPCTYKASSTFSGESGIVISVNNLANYDGYFWCSEVSDNEPYIEIKFDEPHFISTAIIYQHFYERRVDGIEIRAHMRSGEWQTIAKADGLHGKGFIRLDFVPCKAEKFRIYFTKLIADSNGYSIPNITYAVIL